MKRITPYWETDFDWSHLSFYIKSLDTKAPLRATEVPQATLPMYAFLFLLEGEVLADIDGKPYLCRGGQFLLIPEKTPFAIHYYKDLVGYTGCFSIHFLRDVSYHCLAGREPVLHTFWFDEAAFVGGMLDRVTAAQARGDMGYISRAFDLLLYGLQSPAEEKAHPVVNRFMEMIFDRGGSLDSVSGYAARLKITPSYLNKLVRMQTRHSAMEWVEIARINWSKSLLRDKSLSIGEISRAVGMDDPSYFTRFFRKYTDMTPSAFRRKMERTPEPYFSIVP